MLNDYFKSDLQGIFLNSGEFAETHKINGKSMVVVVDDDRLMKRNQKEFLGESLSGILYFVNTDEFGELPEQGTPQTFDGRMMFVFDAKENNGMYEIVLHQNRGE